MTEAQGWIEKAAPVVPAPASLRVINAVPQIERAASPAWSALAFEPGGKLLVRTVSGVVRVDPGQVAPLRRLVLYFVLFVVVFDFLFLVLIVIIVIIVV